MSFTRADRRREFAKRRDRIDAPPDVDNRIRAEIASAVANRRLEFNRGDTVDAVLRKAAAEIFKAANDEGFVLSFDVPEMTPQALSRGIVAYSLKRV